MFDGVSGATFAGELAAAEPSVTGADSGPDDWVDGDESSAGELSGGDVSVDGDVSEGDVGGEDVDAEGERVSGHGDGVTPPLGVGVSVPVTVTHGTGDDGETDVDGDVDAEVDGDLVGGGGGGGVGWSLRPWSPCFRANQLSSFGSYTTKTFTTVTDGATTITWSELYPCHAVPVVRGVFCATGSVSGLPQAQRTRGTPRLSTRTAVPDWSTAWYVVAEPSRYP